MSATSEFLGFLGPRIPCSPRLKFIRTRYPHTYAYDYVRTTYTSCSGMSRGEVGELLRNRVPAVRDRLQIQFNLADLYMIEHDVAHDEADLLWMRAARDEAGV